MRIRFSSLKNKQASLINSLTAARDLLPWRFFYHIRVRTITSLILILALLTLYLPPQGVIAEEVEEDEVIEEQEEVSEGVEIEAEEEGIVAEVEEEDLVTAEEVEAESAADTTWEFNGINDPEGWTFNSQLDYYGSNGVLLSVISNGDDGYMVSPDVAVDATLKYKFLLRSKITAGDEIKLYWERDDAPSFEEARSAPVSKVDPRSWQIYRLNLSVLPEWKGQVTQLRLDPSDSAGADIEIDYIRLLDNAPPTAIVTLGPDPAYTEDVLTAIGSATDPDPDRDIVSVFYRWLVNGSEVLYGTEADLHGTFFGPTDVITVEAIPFDGFDMGVPATASITIQNRLPVAKVSLEPNPATSSSTLTAVTFGNDQDGDSVTFKYRWLVNGKEIVGVNQATLSSKYFSGGSLVVVEATPYDGHEYGATVSASIRIENDPEPPPPVIDPVTRGGGGSGAEPPPVTEVVEDPDSKIILASTSPQIKRDTAQVLSAQASLAAGDFLNFWWIMGMLFAFFFFLFFFYYRRKKKEEEN